MGIWLGFHVAAGVNFTDAQYPTSSSNRLALDLGVRSAARFYLRGAAANGLGAVLCLVGWELMRRRLPGTLALGAIAVMVAALIIAQRSLIETIRVGGFQNWGDLVIELPLLFYAIIYAWCECKKAAV